jgi:hypothetical protein
MIVWRCHPRPTVEFSRRKRGQCHPKSTDLARAAVGWNDLFGDPVAIARAAKRMSRPHQHPITASRTGRERNHAQHTIRLLTPSTPHNGRSYHRQHHARRHDRAGTTGVQVTRFAASKTKKTGNQAATSAERHAVQLPQAQHYCVSKTERSRARSGRLQRRVGRVQLYATAF